MRVSTVYDTTITHACVTRCHHPARLFNVCLTGLRSRSGNGHEMATQPAATTFIGHSPLRGAPPAGTPSGARRKASIPPDPACIPTSYTSRGTALDTHGLWETRKGNAANAYGLLAATNARSRTAASWPDQPRGGEGPAVPVWTLRPRRDAAFRAGPDIAAVHVVWPPDAGVGLDARACWREGSSRRAACGPASVARRAPRRIGKKLTVVGLTSQAAP